MTWLWAMTPVLVVGAMATSDPDDGLDGLSDDEFAATCVDLFAETIESVVLCVVGLDGSITEIADGLVPGR